MASTSQPSQPSKTQQHIAHDILQRAHSPDTSERLFTERIKQKPLFLRPTSPTPADNRSRRRLHRQRKKEYFLSKQKPKPLSAREKRILGLHDLPKEEVKYDIFKALNKLWIGYMREVLDLEGGKANASDRRGASMAPAAATATFGRGREGSGVPIVTPLSHGSKLASADYHGAEMEVVRSRCVSRVGVRGIVVRDSKFAFVLVTKKDEVKTIPKEHTVFKFEVPVCLESEEQKQEQGQSSEVQKEDEQLKKEGEKKRNNLVFELHGSQFENRAPDRANKKFKWRNLDYL